MKTATLCLLALFTLLLSSCHTQSDDFISKHCPGSCTVIKGTLTTDARDKPLAGVKLEVIWFDRDALGLTSVTRRKAVTTTDANGNFELRFLLRDDELPNDYANNGSVFLIAHVNTEHYLTCLGGNILLDKYNLKRDTTIALNYNLPRKAFVQVQLLNATAMQQGDYATTQILVDAGEAGSDVNCLPGRMWSPNHSSDRMEVAANQQVIIRTAKRKSGVETLTEETVTLKPGQTLNYEITF